MIISFLVMTIVSSSSTTTTITASVAGSTKGTPKGIFGICNRNGTFYMPQGEIEQRSGKGNNTDLSLSLDYTKIQWRVSEGKAVVKFKVDLKDLCKNLSEVMENVRDDIQRMIFKKPKRNTKFSSTKYIIST